MDVATLIALFIAGNFMFLAPCTLPLIPGYLALISNRSIDEVKAAKDAKTQAEIFMNGAAFIFGFSLIFVMFGLLIGLLGSSFLDVRDWIIRLSGLVVIVFGLTMLGFGEQLRFLNVQKRVKMPTQLERGKPTSSFVMGAAFGTGWTPCVGPALGAAIGLASNSSTALQGGIQLAVFSAGMAIPFLIVAASAEWVLSHMGKIMKIARVINIVGAVFFIGLGIILLTNNVHLMSEYSFKILEALGLESLIERL